jgi:hypothetical protein
MKPKHFKMLEPHNHCQVCDHSCWITDQNKWVCTKNHFTLPDTEDRYICDYFKEESPPDKLTRISVLDLLGDSPYPTLRDKPRTLIVENAFVESYSMTDSHKDLPKKISGDIHGNDNGIRYEIKFQATKLLVEV